MLCSLALCGKRIHSGAVARRRAAGLVVGDKVILLVASLAKFLVDLVIHGYSSFKMRSSVTGCMLSYTVPIVFPFSPCTDNKFTQQMSEEDQKAEIQYAISSAYQQGMLSRADAERIAAIYGL